MAVMTDMEEHGSGYNTATVVLDRRSRCDSEHDHAQALSGCTKQHETSSPKPFDGEYGDERCNEVLCSVTGSEKSTGEAI